MGSNEYTTPATARHERIAEELVRDWLDDIIIEVGALNRDDKDALMSRIAAALAAADRAGWGRGYYEGRFDAGVLGVTSPMRDYAAPGGGEDGENG